MWGNLRVAQELIHRRSIKVGMMILLRCLLLEVGDSPSRTRGRLLCFFAFLFRRSLLTTFPRAVLEGRLLDHHATYVLCSLSCHRVALDPPNAPESANFLGNRISARNHGRTGRGLEGDGDLEDAGMDRACRMCCPCRIDRPQIR